MPKKKGKGKGKKAKKLGKPKEDPALKRALLFCNEKTVKERQALVASVKWVEGIQKWTERNRAPFFDVLRQLDTDADGFITPDEFKMGLRRQSAPVSADELELLVMSVDVEGNGKLAYCRPAKKYKCYGGSLQEFIELGVERVMINHRQDLLDLQQRHADQLRKLKAGEIPNELRPPKPSVMVTVEEAGSAAHAAAEGEDSESEEGEDNDANEDDGSGDDTGEADDAGEVNGGDDASDTNADDTQPDAMADDASDTDGGNNGNDNGGDGKDEAEEGDEGEEGEGEDNEDEDEEDDEDDDDEGGDDDN